MTNQADSLEHRGNAPFNAEVFLPFDPARPVAGVVRTTATALVVTVAGERLALETGSASLALGGHNGERVVVEGTVGPGSPRAGERVYLQCPDRSLLALLAGHGPPDVRAGARRLLRSDRAVSRRWRALLIAVVVAAIGAAAILFFSLDALVKRAVSGIPIAWESALGESLFAAMTAGRPAATAQDAAVVRAAFERLLAHAAAPGCDFEYAVLESPEVNAFALPGCKVVVFTGLIAKAGRPEEVAGVLGHEFQHAVLRHSLQKMVRAAGLPDFFDRLAAAEGGTSGGAGDKALSLLFTHPASAQRSAVLRAAIARREPARYEPRRVP